MVEGLRMEVKAGKVASLTAKSGLEGLRARYDAAGAGKDVFGLVDIGINPSVQDFGISPEVAPATVTLDGKELVKDGRLVPPPVVAAR